MSKSLRHIVLFQFKEGVTTDQIDSVNEEFYKLKSLIPSVHSIEMGANNSPEGIAGGFTHGYILTFKSEQGRVEYLEHKDHKAFQGFVEPLLKTPLAFDFWTS